MQGGARKRSELEEKLIRWAGGPWEQGEERGWGTRDLRLQAGTEPPGLFLLLGSRPENKFMGSSSITIREPDRAKGEAAGRRPPTLPAPAVPGALASVS